MLKIFVIASLLILIDAGVIAAPLDDLFIRYEAQSSAYELAFARVGQARAQRPEIRTYAAMLINDHEAYGDALRDLATSKGIVISSALATDDKLRLDNFTQISGAAFDNAFAVEAERVNHNNMASLRKEAADTIDSDMHSFVDHFINMDAKHEAAAIALSEHVVAAKGPIIKPPPTGDTMTVAPPHSDSSMPVILPPPIDRK